MVHVKEICTALNVSEDIIKCVVQLNEDEFAEVVNNNEIVKQKGEYYFTRSGFCWLVCGKVPNLDYRNVEKAFQLFDKEQEGGQESILKDLKELIDRYSETEKNEEKEPKKKKNLDLKSFSSDKSLPAMDKDVAKWSREMHELIKEHVKRMYQETGKGNVLNFLNVAYKKMRDIYGIVFDQLLKEFLDKYDIDEGVKVSRWRLVCENEQCRSIFESIVVDMIDAEEKTIREVIS